MGHPCEDGPWGVCDETEKAMLVMLDWFDWTATNRTSASIRNLKRGGTYHF